VKGNLRKALPFWEDIGASEFVLSIISKGYYLPLRVWPCSKHIKNHKSCTQHTEFVDRAIRELVEGGCAKEVEQMHVCSPLGVVDNGKKLRLILDLRFINEHLNVQKFKLEDLRTMAQIFERGDFAFSFDLKSGYHHIDIAKEHWCLLGFEWNKRKYVFTVLPFGPLLHKSDKGSASSLA